MKSTLNCMMLVTGLFLSGCFNHQKESKPPISNLENSDGDKFSDRLNGEIISEIKNRNGTWIESWGKLDLESFRLILMKEFPLAWESVNSRIEHIDSLLIKFSDDLFLDIYTYNTVLEEVDGEIFISFGVDQKIFLFNKQLFSEVLTLGSMESIEDGMWISQKKFILLGTVFDSTLNAVSPQIWVFDLESRSASLYSSPYHQKNRVPFILLKNTSFRLLKE